MYRKKQLHLAIALASSAMVLPAQAQIEEIMVNKTILEELQTKYDKVIRTVPQVIIDDVLIGGYHEVEDLMKGTTSVNKI